MQDPHHLLYYVGRDGADLSYREVGEGRPIVLLHGFILSAEDTWIRSGIAARLAEDGQRVRIVARMLVRGTRPRRAVIGGTGLEPILDTFVDTPREALAAVEVPTLVVAGEDEDRRSVDDLAAALPRATLRRVPGDHGTAHLSPEFAAAILEFLRA